MLKGIPIILYEKVQIGTDDFGAPIYKETEEIVYNVLYGEPSSEDIINTNELYGKKVSYVLAIPKGDTHSWENKKVKFNNEIYMTIGKATEGIEDMIPLCWNKKVKVEKYDG